MPTCLVYPRGLRGSDIPLAARILALADVYDALTTARVYKSAINHSEAANIVVAERGRHFDPAVVDAFASIADDFERTGKALADQLEEEAPADLETKIAFHVPDVCQACVEFELCRGSLSAAELPVRQTAGEPS